MSSLKNEQLQKAIKKELYILLQYLPKGRIFENFWIKGTNANNLLRFYAKVFTEIKYKIYKYFYDYLHIEEFIDSEEENSLVKYKLKDYFFYQNEIFYKIIRKETQDKEKLNKKELLRNLTVIRKYFKENTFKAIEKIASIYEYKITKKNIEYGPRETKITIIRPYVKEKFTYSFPIFFNIKQDNELKFTNIINTLKYIHTNIKVVFKDK